MLFAFYTAAFVAVVATLRVITCANAVHALMYLIVSLLLTGTGSLANV